MARPLLVLLSLLIVACVKDPEAPPAPQQKAYYGLFVLNEGQWTHNNASLYFYDENQGYKVYPDVFQQVNQRPLGDVANDAIIVNDTLFIIVNTSRLLYKVQLPSLKLLATLSFPNSSSPRTMIYLAPNKAYVNSLLGSTLYVINPTTMRIQKTIPIEDYTEDMVAMNQMLWVTCGNYTYPLKNDKVAVVSTATDQVVQYIQMPLENPGDIDSIAPGLAAVVCRGNYSIPERSCIAIIDVKRRTVVDTIWLHRYSFDMEPVGDWLYVITDSSVVRIHWKTKTIDYYYLRKEDLGLTSGDLLYTIRFDAEKQLFYLTHAGQGAVQGELLVLDTNKTVLYRRPTGLFPGTIFWYRK